MSDTTEERASTGEEGGEDTAKTPEERRIEKRVAACFGISTLAALALFVVYAKGGHPQAEGALLAVVLGGLGCGFVIWARGLMPSGGVEQQREEMAAEDDEAQALMEELDREGVIGRRKLLTRMLGLAGAALGAALVFPVRSLGPGPGTSLQGTSWKKGARVVDEEGHPVRPDTLPLGGLLTVFPEGHEDAADSQVVLIRVEPGLLDLREGREDWAPEGLIGYSKVCTHAGCPVGLYQAETHQLICPCHQSAFDVLEGARPVFGPATRSLPQLPLMIGPDGVLEARGDFPEPTGPGFWNRK